MKRMGLDIYDDFPPDMLKYLRNYGKHFSKKANDYAVSRMRRRSPSTGKPEKIDVMTKDRVDELLSRFGVTLENSVLYDHVYVANMCLADFYGTAVPDEHRMALFIKAVIDDPDQSDGYIFNRWYADMCHNGMPIEWDDMI